MKKAAWFIGVIIAAVTAVSVILYKIFLKTDVCKFPSKNAIDERKWLKTITHKECYITSYDKLILHGYYVTQKSDNWVIICHGYDSEAQNMACYAEKFYEMGYNVLLPDQRGYGLSEGSKTTMGVKEQDDIRKWIDKLNTEFVPKKIVLFGVSMGAATVMLAAGNKLPRNVAAIIEDCGYTSVYDEFRYNLKRMFHLPSFPFLNIIDLITRFKDGWSLKNYGSCIKAVKKAEVKILFIHGSSDDFVPFYMHDELFYAAECEKEKIVIYGAKHAESHIVNPELYWNTILRFICDVNE